MMTAFADVGSVGSTSGLDFSHLGTIATRLVLALVLGAALAYRPWRLVFGRQPMPVDTAQAQTLIAVAGAILVTMIGDSIARAFGLVGLGGFIRFRSGIKDPRDAAVMFVAIGVGMACGMGLEAIAVVTTLFVALLLVLFDATGTPRRARIRVSLDDAPVSMPRLHRAFPALRVVTLPVGRGPHDVVLEIEAARAPDAGALHDAIVASGVTGIHVVEVIDD
ncbi:MAG: DUF4956 domain-containing protein [Kofleriaceae bacterium]|nr:DUF4956 domain-containing protein [Kofleriaceae bacterium]